MIKTTTPDQLKEIAEKAVLEKYNSIVNQLKIEAQKGKNTIIITDISLILLERLQKDGYLIRPFYKYEYFFFLRKKKKYYTITF